MATTIEDSAGVVLLADGRVLLITSKRGLEIPKGHIEPAETAEQAAIRELREETGLCTSVAVVRPLAMLEHSFQKGPVIIHKRVQLYLGRATEVPELRGRGKRQARWLALAALDEASIRFESHREVLASLR